MSSSDSGESKHTFRSLLAAKKGNTTYKESQAFLLHVFWVAPSIEAAGKLLAGLLECAKATHRDTPCTPTYFFRICNNNQDLCPPAPQYCRDHPHLQVALKKLQVGVPQHAVRGELVKRGLDPDYINLSLDAELPQSLQTQPVALEFTEIYLDERAFMEHAGSRDYLDGYAVVMNPSLHYTVPTTIRMGTPSQYLIESILEPVLKDIPVTLPAKCKVWSPTIVPVRFPMFLSFDIAQEDESISVETLVHSFSEEFISYCTTLTLIPHPLRTSCFRLMCIFPSFPTQSLWEELARLPILRGEIFCKDGVEKEVKDGEEPTEMNDQRSKVFTILEELQWTEKIVYNHSLAVGYILHPKAQDIQSTPNTEPMQ